MRCETSFFSLTLYKKLLTRYWPMWAVWLIGWLGAVPVTLLNNTDSTRSYLSNIAANFARFPAGASIFMACAAIIVAVGVFFYLFKSKSMNLMGSLPLRREGLFATACAAGFTILLAPLVVVVLITLPLEAALGCLNAPALLKLLGGSVLTAFFWFSFAALCCVISGSGVASAAFFAIFNGVILIMSMLVDSLLGLFFYGYAGLPYAVEDAVAWCTPIANLFRIGVGDWWERAWIYAGVGFLMLLAALGLHHIRRAERAGDLVSFTALRYAFKVCVILCGGLSLGMVFLFLFFGRVGSEVIGLPLTICCCVAAVISAFVAEMLLKKTFRVWKSWRWAVLSVLAFALILAIPQYDLIGFENRVPDPSRVASATAIFRGSEIDGLAFNGLIYEQDAVEQLIRLHTYAIENRDRPITGDYQGFFSVELSYTLKSGFTIRREYSFNLDDSPAGDVLQNLLNDTLTAGRASFVPVNRSPNTVSITWDNSNYGTSVSLGSAEAQRLLAAVMEDVDAGRYGPGDSQSAVSVHLYFYWEDSWTSAESRVFYCTSTTTSTNAAIAKLYPTPPFSDELVYPEDAEFMGTEIAD